MPLAPADSSAAPPPPSLGETPPPGPSSDAPPAASLPGQEKIIDLPAPKNYIEDYYPTVFADYFGPAPWVISSIP